MKLLNLLSFSLLLGTSASFAAPVQEPLQAYRLLSLSVHDDLAVVKDVDGKMITLAVGDKVLGGAYTFSKIQPESIVLTDEARPGDWVLVHLSRKGQPSRIQRISPVVPDALKQPQTAYKVENH